MRLSGAGELSDGPQTDRTNGAWVAFGCAFAPAEVELPNTPKCHGPGSRALPNQFKLHCGLPQEIAEGPALVIPAAELVEVETRTDRHCLSEVIQNETGG